jgi:hypothetical protein
MLSRRRLWASLFVVGLCATVARSANDLSVAYYLKDPQVHYFRLTEERLQAFDKISCRIYSLKPSDPIVKALSKSPPPKAPIGRLVEILEATPLKPVVESNGLTVHDWLIFEIVLKVTQSAYPYYVQTRRFPSAATTLENMTFYIQHKPEIDKMETVWAKLLRQQMQDAQPPAPAPK